jgi:hypothetical protein
MRFPILFALLALVLVSGCNRPAPTPAKPSAQTAGGMTITLTTLPSPPHSGDDTLVVTLNDAQTNMPVGNANVTATATMLAPRTSGAAVSGRSQGNGVYNVPVQLGIATRYEVKLHIERTGQPPVDVLFPIEAV